MTRKKESEERWEGGKKEKQRERWATYNIELLFTPFGFCVASGKPLTLR